MSDIDYEALDPGIRRTVRWLRSLGFETTDSGDGVTKPAMGLTWDDGVRDHPHVIIVPRQEYTMWPVGVTIALGGLVSYITSLGIQVVPIGHEGVSIQATIDATRPERAIIDVMHLHDGLLPPGVGEAP